MGASAGPARPALNLVLETEKNIKEKKLYPVRERPFQPNLSGRPLTGKFYARHDIIDSTEDFSEIEDAIIRKHDSKPKDRVKDPETINQEYGWYLEPFIPSDKSDARFYHSKYQDLVMKTAAIIEAETRKMPKKPFTGIPFKL